VTKAVELDVDIADSPAETFNVSYLGGVGVAPPESGICIAEVLLKVEVAASATPPATIRTNVIVANNGVIRLMQRPPSLVDQRKQGIRPPPRSYSGSFECYFSFSISFARR